ncbi:MAG: hypothetical protein JWN64_202 [Parcubacteria group bacterium]|nr:hypothetical protein [Parcubacteria group bacterium]
MENTPAAAPVSHSSRTTPKDFFLWAGALIALYGSITSLITLLFEYINYAFPDNLASYGDPYGGSVRFAMAALIVLVPTMVVLLHLIRLSINKEPGKANIWIRRWALGLTLFIATVSILIDLVTLINTFLGGEITIRFGLKVAVVLLVALGVFMHFLADMKGYWIENGKRANAVGVGVIVLAIVSIVCGFFIIGTPTDMRALRYDEQKVGDLQNIQYQVVNYWQQKQALPKTLGELADPLSGNSIPNDPQSGTSYRYEVTGPTTFSLCATFNMPTKDTAGQGAYGRDVAYTTGIGGVDENWQHESGEKCFTRTIDPERYPAYPKPL